MRRILIAAVASSLLTGAVIAATGVAQSGDDEKDKPPPTMAQALKDRESQRDKHLAAVAKRLDVSASDLKSALDKVRSSELDQAVEDGKLTSAQRAAIVACKTAPLTCDRSNLPAPRFERRKLRMREGRPDIRALRREMRAKHNAFFAAVAKELGKDAADVRKAFEAERAEMGVRRGRHGPGGPGGPGGPHGMVMGAPGPGPGGPGGPEGFGPGGP
jgi:hypothetical protein